MQLTKYLLLLFPYKTITIPSSLSKPEVIARLSDRFIPEAVLGEDNFWNPPARYEGHDLSNHGSVVEQYCFQIDGPFGNKRWTLSTEIRVSNTSEGSHLKLRFTLSVFNLFCTIFVLCLYGIAAIFWIKISFLQIIILQELFLYTMIILAFNYEVETLTKLIKDTLQKPI
jgi:hypothetical protein